MNSVVHLAFPLCEHTEKHVLFQDSVRLIGQVNSVSVILTIKQLLEKQFQVTLYHKSYRQIRLERQDFRGQNHVGYWADY